jgi:hypothetical protein
MPKRIEELPDSVAGRADASPGQIVGRSADIANQQSNAIISRDPWHAEKASNIMANMPTFGMQAPAIGQPGPAPSLYYSFSDNRQYHIHNDSNSSTLQAQIQQYKQREE